MQEVSSTGLLIGCLPVLAVIAIQYRWHVQPGTALYAVARMLGQLFLIGYVLVFIFKADQSWIVLLVLGVMVTMSSWIGLRTVPERRTQLYGRAFVAVVLGGGSVLALVTQGVLQLDSWYEPRYVVPLAGMIFAGAMNSVSLAAERLYAELEQTKPFAEARQQAFAASLIPITNSLFAVGLVSLPGMMTGQILAGASPFVAARYQIMVMCMAYGAAGLAAAMFLALTRSLLMRQ